MQKDALLHELRVIGIRSVFLDISAYLISVLVQGATLSFALGLVLGTGLLFVYLLLLSWSVARSVERPGGRPQAQMVGGYLLRLVLIGAVFLLAMQVSWTQFRELPHSRASSGSNRACNPRKSRQNGSENTAVHTACGAITV